MSTHSAPIAPLLEAAQTLPADTVAHLVNVIGDWSDRKHHGLHGMSIAEPEPDKLDRDPTAAQIYLSVIGQTGYAHMSADKASLLIVGMLDLLPDGDDE